MTRGRFSSKEINERKWRRMKLILQKLKDKSMPLAEIEHIICPKGVDKIGKRTIQNYMAELEGIGLIEYDASQGLYIHTSNKMVFESKAELDLALKHSKILLKGKLVGYPSTGFKGDPITIKSLFRHFKTGYTKAVWKPLEEYLALIEKNGVNTGPIPEFGFLPMVTGFVVYPKPSSTPRSRLVQNVPFPGSTIKQGNPDKHVNPKVTERLIQLQNTLLKELYFIRAQLEHGIPLNGSCDCCPARSIAVGRK